MCHVDLFAADLEGLRRHIPYLSEWGITYLQLMPLFKVPQGDNDGGYAISGYREVNPTVGTVDGLAALASELRNGGLSLVLGNVSEKKQRLDARRLRHMSMRIYPATLPTHGLDTAVLRSFRGQTTGQAGYRPH